MQFYHYMPMGLMVLLTSAGFNIVKIGQWGTLKYEIQLLTDLTAPGLTSPGYERFEWPMKNDPQHPASVWVLAQKP